MIVTLPAAEMSDILAGLRRWVYSTTTGPVLLTDGRRFYDGHVSHVCGGIGSLDPFIRNRNTPDEGGKGLA